MKKKTILLLLPLLGMLISNAGVYRHDKKESDYTALAAKSQFNCVGQVIKDGKFLGSCVLVGKRYILSAAHCFVESSYRVDTIIHGNETIYVNQPYSQHAGAAKKYSIMYNGIIYHCKSITIYPGYSNTAVDGCLDLALAELGEEVKNVTPAVMNASFDELDADVTGAGYGVHGPADKPENIKMGPKKLAGENIIDSIGGCTVNNIPTEMYCDFDHPDNKQCNKMGSAKPRDLEYLGTGGDSGCGLFRQAKTGWELVGILSGGGINIDQFEKTGYYGQINVWTRVSAFREWVVKNMSK